MLQTLHRRVAAAAVCTKQYDHLLQHTHDKPNVQDLDKAAECLMVKQSLHLTFLATPPVAANLYQGKDWRLDFGLVWRGLVVSDPGFARASSQQLHADVATRLR